MANGVDPYQTVPPWRNLIWVCAVCQGQSVSILRIITLPCMRYLPDLVPPLNGSTSGVVLAVEFTRAHCYINTVPIVIQCLVGGTAATLSADPRLYTGGVVSNIGAGPCALVGTNLVFLSSRAWDSYKKNKSNEPRCEKTGLRGFRPGPTQTRLYNYTRWLEA